MHDDLFTVQWRFLCVFQRQSGGITPEDDVAYYGFLNMLDEVLLPSMSLLPGNCCLSEELWSFLKLFPYELRSAITQVCGHVYSVVVVL